MSDQSTPNVRKIRKKGEGAVVWLIADNPSDEEIEAVREVTKAKVAKVETVADYLPNNGGR